MNFLVDENLSPRLARILDLLHDPAEHRVVHAAADLGLQGVSDAEWSRRLEPSQRWAVLTHDLAIRRRPQERLAWQEMGHVVFFLVRQWRGQRFHDQAWMLVRWWPTIVDTAMRANPRSEFFIPFRGAPKPLKPL